jgi:tRNA (mo5U34)-methyltransferase
VSGADLRERIDALGPWFHDLELDGERTAPDHPLGSFLEDLWSVIEPAFPRDLSGCTVLDIGCNAGFYSLRLAERGARVTGIDHDPRYLAQARLAADVRGVDIRFLRLDVYDVERLGRQFDYVLFMGVLYHLRHPLLALERVASMFRRTLVFQTLVRGSSEPFQPARDYPFEEQSAFADPRFPALYFIESSFAGDQTNWWIPNDSAAAAMLRSVGLRIDGHPAAGIYLCSRGATR